MFKPDIAIVLPVYNGSKTISSTIDSLIDQTFNNFELIICDDGSIDDSECVIKKYQDKRIKLLINRHNRGLGYTLNKLINNISYTSKYIAIAEQDDFYYKNRLKLQYDYLESQPDIGLVSGIADHWDGRIITSKFPGILVNGNQYPMGVGFFKLNYREQLKVVNSCMMIRRSIHENYKLSFSTRYPSISVDWDYILRISLVTNIAGIHDSLVRLDRSQDRKSLTANTQLKSTAARKLIVEFFKEFSNILSKEDYYYALATQRYLELSNKKYFIRLFQSVSIFFLDPDISRFKQKFKKQIINPFTQNKINKRDILDGLAWFLTKIKFKKAFHLQKSEEYYNFTKNFVGYGYYDRISMSQRKKEIIELTDTIRSIKPKVILEIGTRKGGTLFMWSRVCCGGIIISIDLPEGPFGGGYPRKKKKLYKYFGMDSNTKMHLIQNNSHSKETLGMVKNYLGSRKIDFLFIDGDHSYEGVKKDFNIYREFVRDGGIIAFHDILPNITGHDDSDKIEVYKFWQEIKADYEHKEIIENFNQNSMGIGLVYNCD